MTAVVSVAAGLVSTVVIVAACLLFAALCEWAER